MADTQDRFTATHDPATQDPARPDPARPDPADIDQSLASTARALLEAYVPTGKAMQLATLAPDGAPTVCNLWFASAFEPDRLWFISRPNREHCANLRRDGRVGGAILAIELDALGQAVQGVSFRGTARELDIVGVDDHIGHYVRRWPSAARAIDPVRLAAGETHHRIYQIEVTGWILYDEEHFRGDPRQIVDAR